MFGTLTYFQGTAGSNEGITTTITTTTKTKNKKTKHNHTELKTSLVSYLNPIPTFCGESYYPHLTYKETEAQGSQITHAVSFSS